MSVAAHVACTVPSLALARVPPLLALLLAHAKLTVTTAALRCLPTQITFPVGRNRRFSAEPEPFEMPKTKIDRIRLVFAQNQCFEYFQQNGRKRFCLHDELFQ